MPARTPELIVALDASFAEVNPTIEKLSNSVSWYKIGLELFSEAGPKSLVLIAEQDKKIFLDLKIHDIPRTVERAVRAACAHGVAMLTVHAAGGSDMLKAAAAAAAERGTHAPITVAVTTLTSLNQKDLSDIGVARSLEDQALKLGELALRAGINGLVTSVHEAPALRARFGHDVVLVTPGIRLPGGTAADQKRIATPTRAVEAGASFLVVGRPILGAPDPARAAAEIRQEILAARPRT